MWEDTLNSHKIKVQCGIVMPGSTRLMEVNFVVLQ